MTRDALTSARRVVIKVGSALLVGAGDPFAELADDVVHLRRGGLQVVVVSSGAIALGLGPMGLTSRPRDLPSLQAAAAAGQSRLMARWAEAFAKHDVSVAQVLLTHTDVQDRRRYLNARNALLRLVDGGLVPIVNENDTVAVEEIKFGDNDNLAADVAGLVSADVVVLLTKIGALFAGDPRTDANAPRVAVVERVADVRAFAGAAALHGTGGMVTKLDAAERAGRHGASTVIAAERDLVAVFEGADVGTWFRASERPVNARKRWIATALRPAGVLTVDAGAEHAMREGASLLPAGVRGVEGSFDVGDAIDVAGPGGVFARGLVGVGGGDLRRIAGLRTDKARETLGFPVADEVVHRDDLVLL